MPASSTVAPTSTGLRTSIPWAGAPAPTCRPAATRTSAPGWSTNVTRAATNPSTVPAATPIPSSALPSRSRRGRKKTVHQSEDAMSRTRFQSALLAACFVFGSSSVAVAQSGVGSKATPRIGLVLSGGGARGLAHVGVLKVLEELRVPVHCVTGTSMGAIVGGAYAAGATASELEQFVRKADWDDVFRDSPPRTEISTRRKIDDYKTLFAPEYGVTPSSLFLPKGLIAGVSIEGFFRQLTQQVVEVGDFDRLPIPFRAVAADIETGEAVVLSRGSLSRAMRASMSVPGAIAPVEIDGRLLVDGGIANNLPIDEARKLCGDVIIAVNISTPALKRDEISSALTVGTQLINFLGKANVERQLASLGQRDVLIAPELGDISAGSFERAADAIRIGEAQARALADSLRRYSLPPE